MAKNKDGLEAGQIVSFEDMQRIKHEKRLREREEREKPATRRGTGKIRKTKQSSVSDSSSSEETKEQKTS